MQSCVCGDGGAVVCVMVWDICMSASVCMAGTKRQGGVVLSLCSSGLKEGNRGSGE